MQPAPQDGLFPATRWSLILRLRTPNDRDSANALNELCQVYWQPLYAYLRRSGRDAESAKDVVQGFLAHFLSRKGFERCEPAGGRFRSFLLTSLRNYLVSDLRRETAIKRGGQVEVVPLDIAGAELGFQAQASEGLSAEAAFDRQWAQTVWNRALSRVRQEQAARGKEKLFDTLKPALTQDVQNRPSELSAATGLTPSSIAVAVHRLRQRLRALVIEELSQTVGAQIDLEDELNYFLSIWSK